MVSWYLRYPLSYRDVEELLLERGLEVDHSTVGLGLTRFRGATPVALCTFYGFACWSVLWANQSPASLTKGAALATTSFAAFRLATAMSVDAIVACAVRAYATICVASLAVIIALPDVGIDQSWTHEGYWQGIFESKQALGAATAMLIILSFQRWMVGSIGGRRLLLTLSLATALNYMSGSRDALGLAVLGCLCLLAAARSTRVLTCLCLLPMAFVALACLVLGFLWTTGEPFIPILGVKVDLTERVLIWSYALSRFGEAPLFGVGLDGFWSSSDVLDAFSRQHGWVLDNYHDGFLAVLMETGIVGMALFAAATLLFGVKALWLGESARMDPGDHRFMVVLVAILYFANLTETYFLRSTNGLATLTLVFSALAGCRCDPVPDVPPRRTPRTPGKVLTAAAAAASVAALAGPARAASSDTARSTVEAMGAGINVLGFDGIWDGHPNSPFRLSDFGLIRQVGFRIVRINVFGFRHLEAGGKLDKPFLRALDVVVETASAAGLIPIIDEHDSDVCQADPDTCEIKLKQFWRQVSTRYAGRLPHVVFELLNEPGGAITDARWNRLAEQVLSIVRISNPSRTIVVALPNRLDGPGLASLSLPDDDRNIIVTLHYYRPLAFTHQGAPWDPETSAVHDRTWGTAADRARLVADFNAYSAWSRDHARPILLGEFGVFEAAPLRSRTAWVGAVAKAARNHGWAWDYWQFDHDFALFDTGARRWHRPILDAVLGSSPKPR